MLDMPGLIGFGVDTVGGQALGGSGHNRTVGLFVLVLHRANVVVAHVVVVVDDRVICKCVAAAQPL